MNVSERAVKEALENRGFTVHRNGWPDFLAVRQMEGYGTKTIGIMGIEVKTGNDKLRPEQKIIHHLLRQARLPVHVLTPGSAKLDGRLPSCHLLTEREVEQARTAAAQITAQIATLEARLADLKRIAEGAAYNVDALGPLLTLRNGIDFLNWDAA